MRVLVALNSDGDSSEERESPFITNCGSEVEDAKIITGYIVNNVLCLSFGLNLEPSILMDIAGDNEYGLQVRVASEKVGEELIRRLVVDGYLDLTDYDVCIRSIEELHNS